MDKIFEVFSNREIALIIWIFLILALCTLNKQVRSSLFALIKLIFATPVLLIVNLLVLDYTLFVIDFLQRTQFWDESLIKDTVFWTLGAGFVLMYNSANTNEAGHFKKVLFDVIKWTVTLEFIVNFYTFGLLTEIILLPILVFIGLIQAYSELYPKYKKVETIFKTINGFIGLSILSYATYKTFNQSEALLTVANLKSFGLPIILTILFLPFIYCLALYTHYEALFVRLPCLIRDTEYRKAIKRQIIWVANFDLTKLLKISGRIAKLILVDESHSLNDIRKISK